MKVTGEIKLRQEVRYGASGATIELQAFWSGGALAKLTKELMKGVSGVEVCRRIDRSTIILLQQPLRVIAEHEYYLVVMREGWPARVAQAYQTTLEYLTEHFPALFGRLKDRLV